MKYQQRFSKQQDIDDENETEARGISIEMKPGFQEILRCIVVANYSEDFDLNSIVSVLRPEDRLLITGRCKAVGN
jgi:hypothetical protein